jgi:hypothetical protein
MVCWTSPRTAHEQTENRNASAVQVVVRACSSTKRKRDAGRALRSRRSTSQESAPLVVRAVWADLRVNSFLLSCSIIANVPAGANDQVTAAVVVVGDL